MRFAIEHRAQRERLRLVVALVLGLRSPVGGGQTFELSGQGGGSSAAAGHFVHGHVGAEVLELLGGAELHADLGDVVLRESLQAHGTLALAGEVQLAEITQLDAVAVQHQLLGAVGAGPRTPPTDDSKHLSQQGRKN